MSRPLVVLAFLAGCNAQVMGPGYDLEALSAASSSDAVRAAMPSEEELATAWTCGEAPSPLTTASAGELWDRCGLGELTTRARFVASPGDRLAAAKLHLWLKSKAVDAVNGPRLLLGEAPFEGDLTLPVLEGAGMSPFPKTTTIAERIAGPGAWGRFPYWEIPGMTGAEALAVDASLPVSTLRFALASHAADGHVVPLVVQTDDGPTAIPLALPGADPATEVTFAPGQALTPPAEGAVRVVVSDDVPVGTLVGAMGPLLGRRIELAMDHAPCLTPPGPGMRCVSGNAEVDTFYIDEAPDADASACAAASVCRSPAGSWEAARELCSFRGKRLPTIFEARRAEIEGPPTWTGTWAGEGAPPLGTCDGAPTCASSKEKLLTDGTPAPTWQALKKAPALCVAGDPWLTAWPPAVVKTPPPMRPDPKPPTEEELRIAWSVKSDVLDDKGICGEEVRKNWLESLQNGGRSTTECRDPHSYITTNEPHRYLFERFLTNAGGIYVGVGSDQSYDFIVEQRPDWAFVFDYDPNVVRFHKVMQPLLRAAETREAFVALWSKEKKDEAADLIGAAWPDEANVLESFYYGYRGRIEGSMVKALTPSASAPTFGFLATPENYAFLRLLAQQKRIVPVGVDMLDTVGMRSVGATAKALGEPVRVYYTSNAPTAWGGQATPEYKANVRSLPMDDRSMVLATFNSGAWAQVGRWRYDVMHGQLQQERLGSDFYKDNKSPTWDRIPGDHGNLTVVGLPDRFVP
ncbi:MAG: hypothetical protein H6738_17445 [Alphaproteobacteria bacterium]|nr:hypothetical protein [Alphaproteobacteria bacterium]MCB9698569.1 hypothetical protein [Alphaproteobacteria bacterium]